MSAQLLRRARIAIYVGVLVVVAYFILRYDMVGLPGEGCSPLVALTPGERLVVDRWVGEPELGALLLFSDGADEILLGKLSTLPHSAPPRMHAAIERGSYWIVTDAPDCPGRDSRVMGPIEPDDVVGRILFSLPW
ncbi:MAG: hypothetical protein WD226_02045 [Planctomycetota bacterium]